MEVIYDDSYTTKSRICTLNYKWTIENFSYYINENSRSPLFSSRDNDIEDEWFIEINPNNIVDKKTYLSVVITLESLKPDVDFIARYQMSILGANDIKMITAIHDPILLSKEQFKSLSWGKFGLKDTILDKSRGYLQNDSLTLLSEIKILVKQQIIDHLPCKHAIITQKFNTELVQYLATGQFTTVTVYVNKNSFQVIKEILIARSPVFSEMLKQEENQNDEIIITDIKEEVFEELLYFFYTNETLNIKKMTENLYVAAEKYQIAELKKRCERVLIDNINVNNATQVFLFADTYNAQELKCKISEFIANNFSAVFKTEGFLMLKNLHGDYFTDKILEILAGEENK